MIGSVKSNVEKGIANTIHDVDSQYGYYDDSDDSDDRLDIQQMDLQEKLQRWWYHSEQYFQHSTPQYITQNFLYLLHYHQWHKHKQQ